MAQMNDLKRYQALVELARSLGRVMELNTLLDEILRRSQEVLGIEACSILLPDRETGDLIIHSARGDKAPLLFALRVPKGEGVAGVAFESGKTVTIKDAQNDPRHYAKIDEKTGFVTRSIITVPLLNGAEKLGVLQVINPIGRDFFDERDETICEAFSGLIISALLRIEAQKRELEQVRVKQEMELANEIQQSFLPARILSFKTCKIRMEYLPARKVGGDFCFVYPCPDKKRFLLGLGDVSGKGVPAALTMARVTATIKAMFGCLTDDLGSWVTELNKQISTDLNGGRFIGLTFLLADAEARVIHVCAAGQYPPFHMDTRQWHQPDVLLQMPFGILPNFRYTSQIFPLERGHCWMLFSDGVTESRNPDGDEFTKERFLRSLQTGMSASAIFSRAVHSWQTFMNHAPQHDDASLLFLDWRGMPPMAELEQTCDPSVLGMAREFVESWAQFAGFDDLTTGQIVLACDEAVTNIYRHAYDGHPGPIALRSEIEEDVLYISLQDEGKPVDASQIRGRPLEKIQPGGLGSFLIAQIFDSVEYIPQKKGTLLKLEKKIPEF
ncbi:MAG: ATP-binding SpoIIE family protein phosphatase [Verrucomicrobiota bacterium]